MKFLKLIPIIFIFLGISPSANLVFAENEDPVGDKLLVAPKASPNPRESGCGRERRLDRRAVGPLNVQRRERLVVVGRADREGGREGDEEALVGVQVERRARVVGRVIDSDGRQLHAAEVQGARKIIVGVVRELLFDAHGALFAGCGRGRGVKAGHRAKLQHVKVKAVHLVALAAAAEKGRQPGPKAMVGSDEGCDFMRK